MWVPRGSHLNNKGAFDVGLLGRPPPPVVRVDLLPLTVRVWCVQLHFTVSSPAPPCKSPSLSCTPPHARPLYFYRARRTSSSSGTVWGRWRAISVALAGSHSLGNLLRPSLLLLGEILHLYMLPPSPLFHPPPSSIVLRSCWVTGGVGAVVLRVVGVPPLPWGGPDLCGCCSAAAPAELRGRGWCRFGSICFLCINLYQICFFFVFVVRFSINAPEVKSPPPPPPKKPFLSVGLGFWIDLFWLRFGSRCSDVLNFDLILVVVMFLISIWYSF
jgi:hypothetical protein